MVPLHRLPALLGLGLLLLAPTAAAQVQAPPSERVPLAYDSGPVENTGADWGVVASYPVHVPDAEWVRLFFADVELAGDVFRGTGSVLRITALEDGAVQELNAIHCRQWRNTSCYFNGSDVLVEVLAAPGTGPNRIALEAASVGRVPAPVPETQCGNTDDRVASNDPRAGRLLPVGCTGWLIDDCARCLLTAGHCTGSLNTVQFNVPISNPNGSINHPPPSDQYAVDQTSLQAVNGGVGNDWGHFGVFANTQTGLLPHQAQGATYLFRPAPSFSASHDIRITGYGVDSGSANQTQQTDVGPLASLGGTAIGYRTDTQGGNSGSPVIWEQTGEAIGIHCHGGCGQSGGQNWGSTYQNVQLQSAIANPLGQCVCGISLLSPAPSAMQPGQSVSFNVGVGQNLVGTPLLKVRYDGGAFVDVPLLMGAPEVWQATLPPPVCGAVVEYYVRVDTTSGVQTLPEGAPGELYSASVGTPVVLAVDDLELDQGWMSGAPADTATAGFWTYGDPNGTSAQPEDDHTPAGTQCWFTGQGNPGGGADGADVDGGRTSLTTPTLDLSSVHDPFIGFWLWFHSEGTDDFYVTISDDGGQNFESALVVNGQSPEAGGGWFYHRFRVADFVDPGANVQVRFRATDLLLDHTIEAAVDDFEVLQISCTELLDDCNGNGILDADDIASGRSADVDTNGIPDECPDPVGTALCFGDGSGAACPCGNEAPLAGRGCVHSGGVGMSIAASGSASVSNDDLVMTAGSCPPGNTGVFYAGSLDLSPGAPLFDGLQCAGGDVRRFGGVFQDAGVASDTGFVAQDPSGTYFSAGATYYFQFWTRDVAGGTTPCASFANFSPACRVTMTP